MEKANPRIGGRPWKHGGRPWSPPREPQAPEAQKAPPARQKDPCVPYPGTHLTEGDPRSHSSASAPQTAPKPANPRAGERLGNTEAAHGEPAQGPRAPEAQYSGRPRSPTGTGGSRGLPGPLGKTKHPRGPEPGAYPFEGERGEISVLVVVVSALTTLTLLIVLPHLANDGGTPVRRACVPHYLGHTAEGNPCRMQGPPLPVV
jgi:hypothetical protein